MTQAFDLAVNALVQAKCLLEQSRALSRPGAAPPNLDADLIRNEVVAALHRRVGQHADRDAAIAAEHEDAILESAWWRHMIARQGGPAAPVSRWADLAAEEFDRRTNNAIATLQRRADESVDAANALPDPVEKHAEIERVAPMPAEAPDQVASGESWLADLIESRTKASMIRYAEVAGKTAAPFSLKEVDVLRAGHRFMLLEGMSDAIARWPAVSGRQAAATIPSTDSAPADQEVGEADKSIAADAFCWVADLMQTENGWSVREHVSFARELLMDARAALFAAGDLAPPSVVELQARIVTCLRGDAPGFMQPIESFCWERPPPAPKKAKPPKDKPRRKTARMRGHNLDLFASVAV